MGSFPRWLRLQHRHPLVSHSQGRTHAPDSFHRHSAPAFRLCLVVAVVPSRDVQILAAGNDPLKQKLGLKEIFQSYIKADEDTVAQQVKVLVDRLSQTSGLEGFGADDVDVHFVEDGSDSESEVRKWPYGRDLLSRGRCVHSIALAACFGFYRHGVIDGMLWQGVGST